MAATINMFPVATLNLMPVQTEHTMGTTLLPATMATAGTTCILLQQAGQTPPPTPSSCKTVRQLRTIKPEILRCKRRIDFNKLGLPRPHAAAVARRNERERNRVKQVNLGFAVLREHVPSGRKNRKMSKVDTLKAAVDYIKQLQQVLEEHEAVDAAFSKGVPTVLAPPPGPEPTHSLPSPGGYSSDSSSCSSHEPSSDLPLSPEEEDLLDFASWF